MGTDIFRPTAHPCPFARDAEALHDCVARSLIAGGGTRDGTASIPSSIKRQNHSQAHIHPMLMRKDTRRLRTRPGRN